MSISAEDILIRVDQTLTEEGGARVIHDLLEKLALEMEEMTREEHSRREELLRDLSESLGIALPEVVIAGEGPEELRERLKLAGLPESPSSRIPDDSIKIWDRLAPKYFALRKKIKETDLLIDVIVERYCEYTGNRNIKKNGQEIIWTK